LFVLVCSRRVSARSYNLTLYTDFNAG